MLHEDQRALALEEKDRLANCLFCLLCLHDEKALSSATVYAAPALEWAYCCSHYARAAKYLFCLTLLRVSGLGR